MNVNPRRPVDESAPDGYQESDRDYVLNNLDLAVRLLDNHGKLQAALDALGAKIVKMQALRIDLAAAYERELGLARTTRKPTGVPTP